LGSVVLALDATTGSDRISLPVEEEKIRKRYILHYYLSTF
jgi:hypothetical protein